MTRGSCGRGALCVLGAALMTVPAGLAQTADSATSTTDEAVRPEAAAREAAAEAIIAREEAASGRPFDPAFRVQVKADLALRSAGELAAVQNRGSGLLPGPLNPGDSAADTVFTPVAPCRIIDTRLAGGMIAAATTRSFRVTGSGFAAQGGSAVSCGVPFGPATAAVINFVAVNAAGPGDLRVTPSGTAMPQASFLNYSSGDPNLNIANGLAIKICDPAAGACADDLTIRSDASATHLVADVLGYFQSFKPDSFRQSTNAVVTIPDAGATPVTMTTVTFTPRYTGSVLVRARGYCNMTPNAAVSGINIFIGADNTDVGSFVEMGVLRLPANDIGFRQLDYSAERVITTTRGVAQTIGVFGRHEVGTGPTGCAGTLTVETLF